MGDQSGGSGEGGRLLKSPSKTLMNMKPPSQHSSLTECFKLNCVEKRSSNVPKKLTAPPAESLFKHGVRALWADKHSPKSLSAFQCHTQQTQQLKQLLIKIHDKAVHQGDGELLTMKEVQISLQGVISELNCGILIANVKERFWQSRDTVLGTDISFGNCPHLLLQGPSGAGKKALAIALLHDIFGYVKVHPEHRPFPVQVRVNTFAIRSRKMNIVLESSEMYRLGRKSTSDGDVRWITHEGGFLAARFMWTLTIEYVAEETKRLLLGGQYPTITVPIATSKHHVEINLLHIGEYDKDVLSTIFKEIHVSSERARLSPANYHSEFEFKLILVLNGEKLTDDAQMILRKLMDRYGDTCKLVLCCNTSGETFKESVIREGIRSRSQVINVEVPSQEEIVKVLTTVAKKESISLPKAFAARIAEHCKDSLRKAIVQLEACKNYQYPFSLDQPVHISHWEEDLVRIVADIVANPTPKRLFAVRVKMQALLTDCVSAILILQKLLEEFLILTDVQHKKQICHWAGFYEIRLRTVPNPIIQLAAFLAKVITIYKAQSLSTRRLSFTASRYSSDFSDYEDMEKSPLVLSNMPHFNMSRTH